VKSDRDLFICPDLEVLSLKAKVLLLSNGEWAALIVTDKSKICLRDIGVL
jgi:hypothetical protein